MQKFTPKNAFSTLAFLASERQIEYQNAIYPLGKLDCYIFFSTYISLLTSYLNLTNSDNIDLYLMEDLENYVAYMGIDTEVETGYNTNEYIKRRSGTFVESIDLLNKAENFEVEITALEFIRYFQSKDPMNYEQKDLENEAELRVFHVILLDNLEIIDSLYDKQKENAVLWKLAPWETKSEGFIRKASKLIEKVAVMPFEDPRCNICGSFEFRENLVKTLISDSDMGGTLILPVCKECRNKHLDEDGWINF